MCGGASPAIAKLGRRGNYRSPLRTVQVTVVARGIGEDGQRTGVARQVNPAG
jgi:hypothetical protein